MSDKVEVTIQIERGALKSVLNILDDPSQCYPSAETATDFFEVHWDLFESLGEEARKIGLTSDWDEGDEEEEQCFDCGRPLDSAGECPDCDYPDGCDHDVDDGPERCVECQDPIDDCTCEREEPCDTAH